MKSIRFVWFPAGTIVQILPPKVKIQNGIKVIPGQNGQQKGAS